MEKHILEQELHKAEPVRKLIENNLQRVEAGKANPIDRAMLLYTLSYTLRSGAGSFYTYSDEQEEPVNSRTLVEGTKEKRAVTLTIKRVKL